MLAYENGRLDIICHVTISGGGEYTTYNTFFIKEHILKIIDASLNYIEKMKVIMEKFEVYLKRRGKGKFFDDQGDQNPDSNHEDQD
jgi:hypothetical protein